MLIRFAILLIFSFLYSNADKLDINYSTFEELMILPLSEEKIVSITEYLINQKIDDIYDLLNVDDITIYDIHAIKSLVKINFTNTGSARIDIPKSILGYPKKYNPNKITYDQLNEIPNVSPIDAVAVLKQQKRGKIRGTFELKNSPGISYYGYKNVLNRISFDNEIGEHGNETFFRYEAIINSYPSLSGIDEEEESSIYIDRTENPSIFYRFHAGNNNFTASHLRYNNTADPYAIYTNKMHLGINDVSISNKSDSFKIDHLIFGNFSATYGQGLVFSSGDSRRARFTGYKWNKRKSGISPDISRSQELTLNGIGLQISNKKLRLSLFLSDDKRDAVINEDGSFTSLIIMRPRLGLGYSEGNFVYENMIDALKERTFGGNFRFSINEGTNIGATYYESLYDRVLDPQIINTLTGGGGDITPELDTFNCTEDNPIFDSNGDGCFCCEGDQYVNDYDEYSGDVFYLNYPSSNSADPEVEAMYSNSSELQSFRFLPRNWHWKEAKSSRRVWGFDFNTVIENIAFQFEYAVLNKDDKDILHSNKENPRALIVNGFIQFDNFNILIVHRNYDLEFDNPYQKSFSNYSRYKNTILEDEYWLADPIYAHLAKSATQPQSEKCTYIESRYQFHQNFVLGLQWDFWSRKADAARYYRMVTNLEWRPLFNYRIYFRYKLQSRDPYTVSHHTYLIKEARIRFKLRLSNYNHLELLYAWNNARFSPRPRLIDPINPYITSMNVGDAGFPDESLGFSFHHNFQTGSPVKLQLTAGALYAQGFLWYIDYSDFKIFDTDFGLTNMWFAFGLNPVDTMRISFKVSHTWTNPNTGFQGVDASGYYIPNGYFLDEKLDYRLQIDYEI